LEFSILKGYHLDPHPQANVASEHYAVLNMPRHLAKRKRDRCPETNVTIVADKEAAIAQAQRGTTLYAAKVMGPARSSEGCNIYYILDIFEDN
jgi:hypothetical protein